MKTRLSALLIIAVAAMLLVGCHGVPRLQSGGAYAGNTNVASGVALTAPQPDLYIADAAYKLAYDAIFGVMKFERDNRDELLKLSPAIKQGLDKIRLKVVDIEWRWATARESYKRNPIPPNLSTVRLILLEIQRLVPVAQAELDPFYLHMDPQRN